MKKHSSLSGKEILCLKEFGRRIRDARLAKAWTLEQTEEHGWPAWQHLQQIESGEKNINLITLIRLLRLFDLDPTNTIGNLKI